MDNIKEIHLTPEGRQKLVDELAYREGEKNAEIIERLKEARGFGDLSENAEYDAAKEEQAKNAARIAEIRQILSVAKVVDNSKSRSVKISIGCTVELEDDKGKRTASPSWAPPRPTRSSTRSPTSRPPAPPSSAKRGRPGLVHHALGQERRSTPSSEHPR